MYLLSLLSFADHPLDIVRERVAGLLGNYDDSRSKRALIKLLNDKVEEVLGWASNSIARLRCDEALDTLINCLERDFKNIAYLGWVAHALSQIPHQKALQPLIKTLDKVMIRDDIYHDPRVYPIAGLIEAIKAIGGQEADEAIKRYEDYRSSLTDE